MKGKQMRTDDLFGTEFDWVAVDRHGKIGIFSTAGSGPVPQIAIQYTGSHKAMIEWIRNRSALPIYADYLTFSGDLPIYVFDWGPHHRYYSRIRSARGDSPLRRSDLPQELHGALVEFDFDFDVVENPEIGIEGEQTDGGHGYPANS